ncbi:DUF3943 domain-containing protein [Geomonas sp. Red32]|uniref:DUF3943 domain-containing protein n=1 Tax=Geomonas sp. Red32 TaxID=2912856 RepID=UPI00202CF4A0|nr:DUF3943 domain-containing protein [Geomonas sp. Red32]
MRTASGSCRYRRFMLGMLIALLLPLTVTGTAAATDGVPPALAYSPSRPLPDGLRRTDTGTPAAATGAEAAPRQLRDPGDVVHSWETGEGKSYLIPAVEIPAFLFLLNMYDRVVYDDDHSDTGERTYYSNFDTIWRHLSRQEWGYDQDPFNVNQFAHPYQGATMYGLARSCGLGFWESWAYSNAGSFLWKMAGETGRPSINDMATTGNSGSLLGEALFRMSQLILKEQGSTPDLGHELGAAIVSPTTSFNRFAFGDRFKPLFPSHDPATFWRFRLGAMIDSQQDATIDFAMSYGLPGKPGYTYTRPLDYFDFQISGQARESNPVGNVLLRGLLYGKSYEPSEGTRGIWGLYGSYDYISPTIFRVSNTALSLGTTWQNWLAPEVALQGSALAGAGYGAAGVTPRADGQRDYHYGITPQGTLSLRLIMANRVALESVARGYFVSGTGSDNAEGSEAIVRSNTNLIFRIFRRHGLGFQYIEALRVAKYGNLPTRRQSNGTVGIFYTFLGDAHLGAVEWDGYGAR